MKIAMLAGKGESTRYIFNGISEEFEIEKVVLTDAVSSRQLLRRRVKKLGIVKVANQVIFQAFICNVLRLFSKKKILQRIQALGLKGNAIPASKLIDVGFVNGEQCIKVLKEINPDVVIVNGTSIISKKVLECTSAIFINTHVGITPQYRGVHGGYWALRENDAENFGVTVHKVDTGIDTGDIIYQDTCSVSNNDNFLTYPLYQYALAIPLLKRALQDIRCGNLQTYKKVAARSKLYYHPTATQYLYGLMKYGVK